MEAQGVPKVSGVRRASQARQLLLGGGRWTVDVVNKNKGFFFWGGGSECRNFGDFCVRCFQRLQVGI